MSNTHPTYHSSETTSNSIPQTPLIDSVPAGTAANIASLLDFLATGDDLDMGLTLALSAASDAARYLAKQLAVGGGA